MSVTSLLGKMKAALAERFADVVAVGVAEKVVTSAARHTYFTLVDGDTRLRAVVMRGYRGHRPAEGQLVRVSGSVIVYPPKGDIQFSVTAIEVAEVSQ